MSSLPPTLARLVDLSTAVVVGDWDALRRLRLEAPAGEPNRAWREAALQAHLFAGFPRLVEALGVLEAAGGLGEPEPDELAPQGDVLGRGEALFARIYGPKAPRVRRTLERYHPLLGAWILGHAYGDVLSRPGLSARERELLAVAALAATDQGRQLASHARGAVRCGATAEEVVAALQAVRARLAPGRFERLLRVVEKSLASPGSPPGNDELDAP